MCGLAYQAVKYVALDKGGKMEIDIKRYARVEKVSLIIFIARHSIFLKLI
jgi:hypothetical protein